MDSSSPRASGHGCAFRQRLPIPSQMRIRALWPVLCGHSAGVPFLRLTPFAAFDAIIGRDWYCLVMPSASMPLHHTQTTRVALACGTAPCNPRGHARRAIDRQCCNRTTPRKSHHWGGNKRNTQAGCKPECGTSQGVWLQNTNVTVTASTDYRATRPGSWQLPGKQRDLFAAKAKDLKSSSKPAPR